MTNKNLCFYYWPKKRIEKIWALRVADTIERVILVFRREQIDKRSKSYMGQFDRRIFSDRRKNSTRALSRFTLWGRRRTFRRKSDQQKGGYVDYYNPLLFILLISAVILNILDAFITITILDLGGWELNPIVRSAIEVYGDKFWVWKFVIVSACVVFLCLHCKFKRAKLIIVSLNIYYTFVVFFNVVQIICR